MKTYMRRRMARRRQSMEKMMTMRVRRSSILARKTVLTLVSSTSTSCRLSITLSIPLIRYLEHSSTPQL